VALLFVVFFFGFATGVVATICLFIAIEKGEYDHEARGG